MSTISGSGDGPNAAAAAQSDRLADRLADRLRADRGSAARSDSQEPFATLVAGTDPTPANAAESVGEQGQSSPLSLLAPQIQNTLFQARASESSAAGAVSTPQGDDDPVEGLLKQFFDISNKTAAQAMSSNKFSNVLPLQPTRDE
jgi:hypothetical protein